MEARTIDEAMESLQRFGVNALTLQFEPNVGVMAVARQRVNNRSNLPTDVTHAHSGKSFGDAVAKVARDAEHFTKVESNLIRLNGQ